jgi:hypothetical protein
MEEEPQPGEKEGNRKERRAGNRNRLRESTDGHRCTRILQKETKTTKRWGLNGHEEV